MKVLSFVDFESTIARSGIVTAMKHHRRALEDYPVTLDTRGVGFRRLGSLLSGRSPSADIIHTHLFGPGSITLAALARRHDLPLICHAHVTREDFRNSFRGSTVIDRPLGWYLKRWYSNADVVLCPSEYTKEVLQGYPVRAPIEVVSNGVDFASLECLTTFRQMYRDRYGLSGPVVFSVGNVFERKGLTTFCRVAERLPHLDFVWFGHYDTGLHASPTVKRWVENPPDNVQFTGWIPEKRGAFAAGDIFFSPTHEENQGIAVLEAMACELPIVIRDIPVFHEYTRPGHDAIYGDDTADFVEAIDALADDSDRRAVMGERALKAAREHRLEIVGERLYELYRDVLLVKNGA